MIQVFPHSKFFVLTFVCPICRYVQCLGLADHLDLGHIARSIWIIKLGGKKQNQYSLRFQLNWKRLKKCIFSHYCHHRYLNIPHLLFQLFIKKPAISKWKMHTEFTFLDKSALNILLPVFVEAGNHSFGRMNSLPC